MKMVFLRLLLHQHYLDLQQRYYQRKKLHRHRQRYNLYLCRLFLILNHRCFLVMGLR
jgi:hypothetical protein